MQSFLIKLLFDMSEIASVQQFLLKPCVSIISIALLALVFYAYTDTVFIKPRKHQSLSRTHTIKHWIDIACSNPNDNVINGSVCYNNTFKIPLLLHQCPWWMHIFHSFSCILYSMQYYGFDQAWHSKQYTNISFILPQSSNRGKDVINRYYSDFK